MHTQKPSYWSPQTYLWVLTAILLATRTQVPQAHADQFVIDGSIKTTTDTEKRYVALGSVETSGQPPGTVDTMLPIPDDAAPQHWKFNVAHRGTFAVDKVTNAQLGLRDSWHLIGPPGPHHKEENKLPDIWTPAITIPVGRTAEVSTWGRNTHEPDEPLHKDTYILFGVVAYQDDGALRTLGGDAGVLAWHPDARPWRSLRIGASLISSKTQKSGSSASYDAATGTLSFTAGAIDVLDREGGLSGGIDPKYQDDPVLDATLQVSDLTFEGQDGEGRYVFSGGSISVLDKDGNLALTADFEEYIIDDTSESPWLSSFGILSNGQTLNMDGKSPWLSDFVQDHLAGGDDEYDERYIDFAFITDQNLADSTAGFTEDAWDVPADLWIGGNGVPEPASAALLMLGVPLLCRQRGRSPRKPGLRRRALADNREPKRPAQRYSHVKS